VVAHRESVSGSFQRQLVVFPIALSLIAAVTLLMRPTAFANLLSLDVSFLAQAHVAATFCRVWSMRLSNSQRRILSADSLLFTVGACVVVSTLVPIAILVTLYIFWQAFHYARQAYGIERIIRRHDQLPLDQSASGLIYAVAASAFFWRLHSAPPQFLGLPIVIPPTAVCLSISIVAAIIAIRAFGQVILNKRTTGLSALFLASDVLVFLVAYVFSGSLEQGWLIGNVWHNTQYILIVRNSLLATESAPGTVGRVVALAKSAGGLGFIVGCVILGTAAYGLLGNITRVSLGTSGAILVAIYMAINFHHYIVDSLVWKKRSKILDSLA
jgi:hypothetical protein